jgi:hypothetical protein
MSTHRIIATTVAITAAFTLSACKKKSEAAQNAATVKEGAPPVSAEDAELAADDALSTKLGFYIECINNVDPFVSESHQLYVKFIENNTIVAVRPPVARSNSPRLTACFKAIEDAAAAEPKRPEVEQAATAYRAAHEQLEPLVTEAYRYYSQGDYKDDNLAHGNELHPKIMAGYEAVFASRKNLRAAVDHENDALLARGLARIEKEEGKSLRYYTRRVLSEGEATLELALDPATDPAKLRDAIEAYKTLYAELLDRKAKHPEEAERGGGLVAFVGHGDLVLGAFKEMQRIANAKLEGKPGDAELEDIRRQQLLDLYNSLVDDSNELEWKKAGLQ